MRTPDSAHLAVRSGASSRRDRHASCPTGYPPDPRGRGLAASAEWPSRSPTAAAESAARCSRPARPTHEAGAAMRLWCNARIAALNLYLTWRAWRCEGEEFEIPGIGPHLLMCKRARPERPPRLDYCRGMSRIPINIAELVGETPARRHLGAARGGLGARRPAVRQARGLQSRAAASRTASASR